MGDDKKVVDISLRRVQQRKQRGESLYDDSVRKAADEICNLYGRIASQIPTVDLLTAIYLSERALYATLRHSVGEDHTASLRDQAVVTACTRYEVRWPDYENRRTVFDKDLDDEPEPTG